MKSAPNIQLDDVALLKAISNRDESAFTKLYALYQPRLLKFCAGYLKGDVALAADVADDALFDVWNKAASYKETARVSTWIFTIARNKTIDFLRKKRELSLADDDEVIIEDGSAAPDELTSQANEQERIKECLAKLSDNHREMILLMYYQGLTIREIAVITNNPENTVKTRMFHAREKMNKQLLRMGIEGYP